MSLAPDESDRHGALSRDPACHACGCPHHILPCDRVTDGVPCDCPTDYAPGIY